LDLLVDRKILVISSNVVLGVNGGYSICLIFETFLI